MTQPTLTAAPTVVAPPLLSPEQGRALLATYVQQALARGARIESHSDFSAVLVYGRPINHLLHLVLSILTLGLWATVWLLLVLVRGEQRFMVAVDPYGQVSRRNL